MKIHSASDNSFVNMNPAASIIFNKYGMMKEYYNWRGMDMNKKTGHNTGKPGSAFYKAIKPIIFSLRLIGGFPYFEYKGSPRFKLFSCWTLYSVIFMSAEMTLLCFRMMKILFDDDRKFFDNRLRSQMHFFIDLFRAFGPLTLWLEVVGIVKYFSKWNSFQDLLNTNSIVLDINIKKWIYGLMLVCLVYVTSMSYFELRYYGGVLQLIAVVVIHSYISLTMSLVYLMGLYCKSTASCLGKQIRNSRRAQDIALCRNLWVKLAHLTTEVGNVLGPTMMEWLLLGSIVTIISCYSLIFILQDYTVNANFNEREAKAGTFFLTISFFVLIFLIEFGHGCTSSVGTGVQTELLRLSSTGKDKEFQQEVNIFLETIHFRYPNFVLCGFITLNRRHLVSLISSGITYLIVLVQFRSNHNTEELSENNDA